MSVAPADIVMVNIVPSLRLRNGVKVIDLFSLSQLNDPSTLLFTPDDPSIHVSAKLFSAEVLSIGFEKNNMTLSITKTLSALFKG